MINILETMDDKTLKLAQKLARQSAPEILKGVNEDHEEQDENPLPLTRKFENKFKGLQRTRSLIGPSPIQQFGPRACINKNSVMEMTIQDPGSQKLSWDKSPSSVLVIKEVHGTKAISTFIELVKWFIEERKMTVYIEESIVGYVIVKDVSQNIKKNILMFTQGKDDLTNKIDFIVCLGGDETLLHASSLFQENMPPVMAFHLGSLGFLTTIGYDNIQRQITEVLEGNPLLTLRSRLQCIVVKKTYEYKSSQRKMDKTMPITNRLVLNDVVIDRGPSPFLTNIDLYLDGKWITSVQGDGLIISVPTGSTAYAGAAGASMIHPSVPAIMVTPICPHSLSFRPVVVPAGVEVRITISPDSRNTAWMSFDGQNHQELEQGMSLLVTCSVYPVPSICSQDQMSDWFTSLAECLHWNERKTQKRLEEEPKLTTKLVTEEKPEPSRSNKSSASSSSSWSSSDGDSNDDSKDDKKDNVWAWCGV